MLEQLQRLQAHVGVLKTRLLHLERDNEALVKTKDETEAQHHSQIVQKNSIITAKQEEIETLNDQLSQLQGQFKQLNTDATALADRYSRLEKSCTDLKNRFQEILAERNDLRVTKEKLQAHQRQTQQEIQELQQDRDRLLKKMNWPNQRLKRSFNDLQFWVRHKINMLRKSSNSPTLLRRFTHERSSGRRTTFNRTNFSSEYHS